MAEYGRAVYSRIAASVQYPERAARENRQGTVMLRLVVGTDGRLSDVSSVDGAADPVLRDAAIAAVRRAAPFAPPPRQVVGGDGTVSFRIPVRFYFSAR